MKKIIILTGSELRHKYFYNSLIDDERFEVLAVYSEGKELSLLNRTLDKQHSMLEIEHAETREKAEFEFFDSYVKGCSFEHLVKVIKKGDINRDDILESIKTLSPDLLICYGSSLVKDTLVNCFPGHFLNVHLGLSPYYRGSGTNIWPFINNELDMVGATFMYIDVGIDTGKIIHQIRADINENDVIHSLGNNLIVKMTRVYADIIYNFDQLSQEIQPDGEGKLYLRKHFDSAACDNLYTNLKDGVIFEYVHSPIEILPYIVRNRVLESV